jgi:hypothetical protein
MASFIDSNHYHDNDDGDDNAYDDGRSSATNVHRYDEGGGGEDDNNNDDEEKKQYDVIRHKTTHSKKMAQNYYRYEETTGLLPTLGLLLLLLSVYACALQYSLVSDVMSMRFAHKTYAFTKMNIGSNSSSSSSGSNNNTFSVQKIHSGSSARQLTSIRKFGINIQSSPVSYFNEILKPSERRRITLHI